jgi:hypothetical protein
MAGNEAKFQCIADNGLNENLRKEITVFVNGMNFFINENKRSNIELLAKCGATLSLCLA